LFGMPATGLSRVEVVVVVVVVPASLRSRQRFSAVAPRILAVTVGVNEPGLEDLGWRVVQPPSGDGGGGGQDSVVWVVKVERGREKAGKCCWACGGRWAGGHPIPSYPLPVAPSLHHSAFRWPGPGQGGGACAPCGPCSYLAAFLALSSSNHTAVARPVPFLHLPQRGPGPACASPSAPIAPAFPMPSSLPPPPTTTTTAAATTTTTTLLRHLSVFTHPHIATS
jgi:hypothetical protein